MLLQTFQWCRVSCRKAPTIHTSLRVPEGPASCPHPPAGPTSTLHIHSTGSPHAHLSQSHLRARHSAWNIFRVPSPGLRFRPQQPCLRGASLTSGHQQHFFSLLPPFGCSPTRTGTHLPPPLLCTPQGPAGHLVQTPRDVQDADMTLQTAVQQVHSAR